MKIATKKLAQTALLLAVCLISQYFKNLSVYITGPIINAVIIIAVITVSLGCGLIISIIVPITAFFFTGSPILAAIPVMFLVIMAGNSILALCTWFFNTKMHFKGKLPLGMITGSVMKSLFMGVLAVFIILPLFGNSIASHLPKPEALPIILQTAKVTYSVTQLFTALIGSLLAYLILIPLRKYLAYEEKS